MFITATHWKATCPPIIRAHSHLSPGQRWKPNELGIRSATSEHSDRIRCCGLCNGSGCCICPSWMPAPQPGAEGRAWVHVLVPPPSSSVSLGELLSHLCPCFSSVNSQGCSEAQMGQCLQALSPAPSTNAYISLSPLPSGRSDWSHGPSVSCLPVSTHAFALASGTGMTSMTTEAWKSVSALLLSL